MMHYGNGDKQNETEFSLLQIHENLIYEVFTVILTQLGRSHTSLTCCFASGNLLSTDEYPLPRQWIVARPLFTLSSAREILRVKLHLPERPDKDALTSSFVEESVNILNMYYMKNNPPT